MAKLTNPLLRELREADLTLPCIRVYTTVRKDGFCRVKFYWVRCADLRRFADEAILFLTKHGWQVSTARPKTATGVYYAKTSFTIVARQPA